MPTLKEVIKSNTVYDKLNDIKQLERLHKLSRHDELWFASVRVEQLKNDCETKQIYDFIQDVETKIDKLREEIEDKIDELLNVSF